MSLQRYVEGRAQYDGVGGRSHTVYLIQTSSLTEWKKIFEKRRIAKGMKVEFSPFCVGDVDEIMESYREAALGHSVELRTWPLPRPLKGHEMVFSSKGPDWSLDRLAVEVESCRSDGSKALQARLVQKT